MSFQHIKFAIIGISASFFLLASCESFSGHEREKVRVEIDGIHYTLLTARTPAERTKGLSGIKELKEADGMIFYFDPPQRAVFWNRNTHLDLELFWYRDGMIIGRNTLMSEDRAGFVSIESPSEVDAVIELVK